MKNTKKIFSSIVLIACLFLMLGNKAYASSITSNETTANDRSYMAMVIHNNSNVEINPTDSYQLEDVSGNQTFTCIEFDVSGGTKGFGIIDLSSYEVVMYALDATIPFSSYERVVYDGSIGFAVINHDNTATILNSGMTIPASKLYNSSRERLPLASEIVKDEKYKKEANKELLDRSSPVLISGGSNLNLVYNAGSNSYPWTTDCGINAVAIYLRHMDNYFNNNYVPSSQNTENKLKVAIAVISDDLYGYTTSIPMDNLAAITNKYMITHSGSGTSYVSKVSYTWTKYKNRINNGNGMPCILYIGGGTTGYWTSAHAVVGVGYTSGATSSSGYDIVNSGWTSLGYVQISTSVPGSIIR